MGTVIRIRAKFAVAVAIVLTALLALLSPVTQIVVNLTATGLFMGGTGHPLIPPYSTPSYISTYINNSYNKFVAPSELCDPSGCAPNRRVAVYTPEQLWPVTGLFDRSFDWSRAYGVQLLDSCLRSTQCTVSMPSSYNSTDTQLSRDPDNAYTVFGYSQSSAIASMEKTNLINSGWDMLDPSVNFMMLANPNRPNGGILSRFAGLSLFGITFNGSTPTNSDPGNPLTTVDITRQYDGISDFPANPFNLLAVLNAVLGVAFLHSGYNTAKETPLLQGQYQDTTYYMIPTPIVPLLMPLNIIPIVGPLVATALDPFVRVLVEAGYTRTANPGAPNPPFYWHPLQTLMNLVAAIPVAIDNVLSYITGNPSFRPLGTLSAVVNPYGAGGPPVDAGAIDPYGQPTPALMGAAPMTMMFAAASDPADAEANPLLTAARSAALFSAEPDPSAEQTDPTTTDPTTTEPTPSATTDPTPTATPSATTEPAPSATTEPTPSVSSSPAPSPTTEPTTSSSSSSTSSTSTSSTSTSTSGSTSSTSTGSTSTSTSGSTSPSSTGSTSTGSTSTSTSGSTSPSSTGSTSTGSTSTSTSGSTTTGTSGSTSSGSTSSGSTSSGSTSSGSSTSGSSTSGSSSSSGSSSGSSSSGSSSSGSSSSGSSSSGSSSGGSSGAAA